MTSRSALRLATARRGSSSVASAGLWSSHQPTPASTSHLVALKNVSSNFSGASHGSTARRTLPISAPKSTPTRVLHHTDKKKHRNTVGDDASNMFTSFTFDPPFTPVDGEAAFKKKTQYNSSGTACVYVCRRCRTPVFHSRDLAHGSRVGRHSSGWPTFLEPFTNSAVRLHTVLQKSVVADVSNVRASSSTVAPANPAIDAGGGESSSWLKVRVPDVGVAPRGLPVEGDLVRLRGRQIGAQHTHTWREACLRDENHRVDPAIVLGCCGGCGTPVCQVTHSAVGGSRYVATSSCITAVEPDGSESGRDSSNI